MFQHAAEGVGLAAVQNNEWFLAQEGSCSCGREDRDCSRGENVMCTLEWTRNTCSFSCLCRPGFFAVVCVPYTCLVARNIANGCAFLRMYVWTHAFLACAGIGWRELDPFEQWRRLGAPKYIMAPMVEQSELCFRMLCRRYGTQLCYTPMMHR